MKRLSVLLVLVLAAVASACGDDGPEPSAAQDTLTRDEFVEQANALCVDNDTHIGEIVGQLFDTDQPAPADMQAALDDIVTTSRTLADELDALAEPRELTDEVTVMIADLDAATDDAEAQDAATFFASQGDPWAAAQAKAAELGLDACAGEAG